MVVQNVQDLDVLPKHSSDSFDDDGRPKRTGTVWTASAHIITAVIGSGVLSLAWAVAQIGWIGGPVAMLLFSFVTFYTSTLLCSCYRSGDSVTGKRNYTYMDAIHSNLGGIKVKVCGVVQYVNLFGTAIGYTIASAISLVAIQRTSCQQMNGPNDPCHVNGNVYMIAFGIVQIIFSQIPDFDQLWWLSIVAAVMSFAYSAIGLGLGVSKVVENKEIKGSLTGVTVGTVTLSGTVTSSQKIWRTFQSLGNIAFAYSYSMILIEIQDTVKSPPAEVNTMRKATFVSVAVTTVFYMLCGCVGYAAFGDNAPGNLLAHGGFRNPYWLLDIANLAIVIHLVGAYQVYCQPLFAFVEKEASRRFPESEFVTKEIKIQLFPGKPFNLNLFRLVWRTFFVITTTLISMLMPFFNDVVGLLGAIGFWPLTVYFPVEMYIAQKNVPRWGTKWVCLQVLSVTCLFVSVAAAAGSVIGIVSDLKVYKPFQSEF
ncbi:Amino acid permease 5 [Arabidopsis thaliana]|uniref:AAP5 n=2 Tax=Arabidopsis TaxID=3701 RepID=A0A178W5P0_ARATH|nr:Amino acid transporter transmembrane domain [Arabidopsis thaliana x Arabidopsis arenosa]OAP13819.1 AAP5 [Arabidopsis thaliana]CAA54632.1 amino acid permease [Arabidopsis thaliana]